MVFKMILLLLVLSKASNICKVDDDCADLNYCVNGECKHKSLFPLETTEYIGLFVMIIISIISNAGGVGGSSMIISLMLILHKFDTHKCVAMTQVFILSGTATAIFLKFKDRHPTKDKPLIYYDALMQIVSPILVGVSVGVMINPAFPAWLILALLTIVVSGLVWGTFKRGMILYKKESQVRKETVINTAVVVPKIAENLNNVALRTEMKENVVLPEDIITTSERPDTISAEQANLRFLISEDNKGDENEKLAQYDENERLARCGSKDKEGESVRDNDNEHDDIHYNHSFELDSNNEALNHPENTSVPDVSEISHIDKTLSPDIQKKILDIYTSEKKMISYIHLFYFIILTGVSITFTLLKGSSSSKSLVGIKQCSPSYFGLTISYFIFMILMNLAASFYLVKKTEICEKGHYSFDDGDIKWTYKKCFIVTIASVGAGIVVGLLGLGGGNLIGPMLLYLGVRPEISTISSSFTIFISSGTAAAQYFILGMIDFSYTAWFFGLSIIGSLCGMLILRKYAIKKQRVSLLIFCLSTILFCSLILIPIIGVMDAIKQSDQGTFQLNFKTIC
ncbi:hypothetical protein SteCoe_1948 [Stentor coeruleus]|uniref:Sulfite exporter TauE/SafE n=1 Tax=Stentor coeruleus TaxID=5963 RepID=A0A1R2D0H7_9CILI|nr:hypothetical protein SteCoe_1948 [Stentor coeruleus]